MQFVVYIKWSTHNFMEVSKICHSCISYHFIMVPGKNPEMYCYFFNVIKDFELFLKMHNKYRQILYSLII